ncbi:MAG: hypothetical protein NTU98_08390 [Bacteroidetes bacterium]|nr:hypothetical protein [Bacteroidota bacterium]
MKLQFRLRVAKNKIGQQEIQVVYNHGTVKPYRVEFSTGVHVYKNDFVVNPEKSKVRIYGEPDNKKIDKILTTFADIESLKNDYWEKHGRGKNYPSPSDLKKMYYGNKKPQTPSIPDNVLVNQFQKWAVNQDVRDSSRKLFVTVKKDLGEVLGKDFEMDLVTKDDLQKLKDYWLTKKVRRGTIGLANSTIGKRWRTVQAFLRSEEDRIEGNWYKFKLGKSIKANPSDVNVFWLSKEEYEVLKNFDFRNGEFTENEIYAIDLYLISCCTGLRIHDVRNLEKDSVYPKNGEKWLKAIVNKRDGILLTYPLSKSAQKIINRIDFNNHLSEQNIRDNLKEVFRKVIEHMPESWTEELLWYRMSGSTPQHDKKPKYELLDFHSSRKTFATLMIPILGAQTVAEIGGWRNQAVMMNRYAGKKKTENLKKYAKL